MAFYNDLTKDSPIASVEFSPVKEGNVTFFRLKVGADAEPLKQWLANDLGQHIEAETQSHDQTVLITRGDKPQAEIFSALKDRGDSLASPEQKGKVNMWTLRGWGSIIGQPMQFISGIMQKGPPDIATIGFAITNMTANLVNVFFGAQREEDRHQLLHIKSELNERLSQYLPDGTDPIDVHDKRSSAYEKKKSVLGRAHDTASHYSVVVGDIGLRFLGAVFLAFPLTKPVKTATGKDVQSVAHWRTAFDQAKAAVPKFDRQLFREAYKTVKNDKDRATYLAGLIYIGGKTLSLTSEVPDPYNKKKKHTALDTFREKYVFPLSSIIEATAAGTIAADRLHLITINKTAAGLPDKRYITADKIIEMLDKPKPWMESIGIKQAPEWLRSLKGRKTRDWLGGIGGAFFTAALILRIFAPFGVRQVNMKEINAHVADTLALVPPDKLPQALAETSAYLTDHFRDTKKLGFGDVYMDLANDLKKFHKIDIAALGAGSAPADAKSASAEPAEEQTKTFTRPELRKPAIASLLPTGSYQDRAVSPVAESIALGP